MSEVISNRRLQIGATLWGMLSVIMVILFFALLTIKIVPSYVENQKIQKALDGLVEDSSSARMNRPQIVRSLTDRLYIDMADELVDLSEALSITKTRNTRVFTITYEKVIPLVYNISALLDFENSAEVSLK